MPTTKLNLPLIDGTNTADVVRDMNALANAVDNKAGASDGLATLDATGKVPASQLNVSAPPDATTTQKGVVQLSNSTTSTSEALAATPKAVKTVDDKVGTLSSLNTAAKDNLVNAVNELFTFANDGKSKWSSVIGSPLASSDTFTQMQTKTQTIKNMLATNLTAKGQSSTGTETLTALVDKVASIQTGLKLSVGNVIQSNALTERGFSNTTDAKKKEIRVNYSGSIRVSFMLRANNQYNPVFGRVYINGIPIGIQRSSSNTYSTFTEDFNVESGDLVQVYCRASDSSYLGYVKEFIVKTAENPIASVVID